MELLSYPSKEPIKVQGYKDEKELNILGPYYLPGPDKTLSIIGLKDIYFGLQESQIFGMTYLYDLQNHKWLRCNEIEIFQIIEFDFEMGDELSCPQFTPPPTPVNSKYLELLHEGAHLFMLLFKKEQGKINKLNMDLNEYELEVYQEKALNEQYREELKSVQNLIDENSYKHSQEKKELENSIMRLEQQLEQRPQETEKAEHKDEEFEELLTLNKKLEKKLSLQDIREKNALKEIDAYKTMLANLKKGVRKFVIDNELLKKQVEKSTDYSNELTQQLMNANHQLKNFELECEQNKKIILKIRNEQQKKSNDEIRRLTGESFELSNKSIWEYKQSGKSHGPFTFEEILDLKRQGIINAHTVLKNNENKSSWMAFSDYFEFNAPFEVFISEEDGKPVKRFFMKRGSIRTPFYDTATISLDDKEIKGFCTSISVGGCFIEFTRIKEDSFTKDQKAVLTINHETLGQAITCPVVIKNISLSRPKGLGVMFETLDNESRILIENYVNQTLKKTRSIQAA